MELDLIGQILVIIAKSDMDEAIQYFAEWKIGDRVVRTLDEAEAAHARR